MDSELELQLEGDAVLAIVGVVTGYPSDELDVLWFDAGPAWYGLSTPEVPEPPLLPPDNCVGLDDDKRGPPVLPHAGDEYPEQSVSIPDGWPWSFPLEHCELLTEDKVADQQRPPRPDEEKRVEHLDGYDN